MAFAGWRAGSLRAGYGAGEGLKTARHIETQSETSTPPHHLGGRTYAGVMIRGRLGDNRASSTTHQSDTGVHPATTAPFRPQSLTSRPCHRHVAASLFTLIACLLVTWHYRSWTRHQRGVDVLACAPTVHSHYAPVLSASNLSFCYCTNTFRHHWIGMPPVRVFVQFCS